MSRAVGTPQTVSYTGADGITLMGDEWNRGQAQRRDDASATVLMLHGGGQNRFSWKKTGQVLADRGYHVVALDTRGHGDSDRAPGADYGLDTLVADVLAVLEIIGRPVVLVGASLGGFTGILTAARAGSERVRGLVLVDVVPRYELDGSTRIRDFMAAHQDGFDSLVQAADAVAGYLSHRARPENHDGLKKNLRLRDGRWYWHWDPALLTTLDSDPFPSPEQLEAAAVGLAIPILLIRGGLSDVVSVEGARDFLAKVPHAEFAELSEAGHTAAGDVNDAFSDIVVEFVSRQMTA
ncbi:MAG TPA: alpha/beta hydrolase [Mycobacterium sp.]